MCFFPLGCLRGIVGIGAVVSIVIALGLLGVTVYANLEKKAIVDSISESLVNAALIGLYISSIIFLLLAISGLYGAIKGLKKGGGTARCLLGFYWIGVTVFFVLFLGACVFFMVGPQTIFGSDCKKGTQSTLIEDLYMVTSNATNDFCTEACPCNIAAENVNSYLATELPKHNYDKVSPSNNNTVYQTCGNFDNTTEAYALTMATFEQTFQCAGWCPDDNQFQFYRFSNINECVTEDCIKGLKSCYTEFETFMKNKGFLVGAGCGVAAVISFLNIITIICICCHPGNKNKSKNFYSRMLATD